MKAYELMKLAAENPAEYEGKMYRFKYGGCAVELCGGAHYVITFKDGDAFTLNGDKAYVSSYGEVEEVKAVPFMEAVKAFCERKKIACETDRYGKQIYNPSGGIVSLNSQGGAIRTYEILHGEWYIEE